MKHHTRLENRQGFTLIELMVVIGIIGLLISILIPTVGKVRGIARSTVTQALMNRMDTAIQQYYADHSAYPGVFANYEISAMQADHTKIPKLTTAPGQPDLEFWYFDLTATPPVWKADPTNAPRIITSTESMYLALVGGLELDRTNPAAPTFKAKNDPRVIADGNISLNVNKPKKCNAYLPLKVGETTAVTMPALFYDPSLWKPGYATKYDTCIPEVIDGFAGQNPILYLRAMRGTSGIVAVRESYTSGYGTVQVDTLLNPTNTAESRQYNPFHLDPYGFPSNETPYKNDARVSWEDYKANFPDYQDGRVTNDPYFLLKGDQRYFANLLTAKPDVTYPKVAPPPNINEPAHKDTYILISAGLDGKFGTKDDITNFK